MTAADTMIEYAPPVPRISARSRLHKVARSDSLWSLIDQGVVSLGNFATTVLVIRGLPMQDCGLYGLLLDATLFLNSVHAPLLIYPLSLRGGATTHKAANGRLASASLVMTALGGILLLLVGVIAGIVTHRPSLMLLAAAAALVWQLQEVARRSLIAQQRLIVAAIGDAISYLGQAIAVWVMLAHGAITLDRIFIVMALTSAIALSFQTACIGLRTFSLHQIRSYAADFLNLGKWPLAASITSIITVPAFSWTLIYFHGLRAGAQNLALLSLLKASHPVMFAAMNLIVPSVARAQTKDGSGKAARRVLFEQSMFGAVILIPYFAGLVLFPGWILGHAYGNQYADCGSILRIIVLSYALIYGANMTTAFLNGLGKTKAAFDGQLANTAAAAAIGLPLTAVFGLVGSAWGGGIAVLARLVSNVICIRRQP